MRMVALMISAFLFSLPAWGTMHEFSDKTLHTKLGLDLPGYDLTFKSDTREIKFKPNIRALYAVGVSLQDFIGINWGFRASQTEKEEALKGETEYEDWRLNLAFRQFHLFLNYSQYRGFFIEDSGEVDNTWVSGQPFVQAPNLSSRTAGANFTWVISPESYSLVAAMDQTERQEKSGGSWLLGLAASETVFRDHDEIIPTQVQSEYGADQRLVEGRFLVLNVKGGYGHMLVFAEKYFASAALQLGGGMQRMKLTGTDFGRTEWARSAKIDALLSFGWNGDDFYSGIAAAADGTSYATGSIDITTTLYVIKTYFGFRI